MESGEKRGMFDHLREKRRSIGRAARHRASEAGVEENLEILPKEEMDQKSREMSRKARKVY
jgi:hypothetical protein